MLAVNCFFQCWITWSTDKSRSYGRHVPHSDRHPGHSKHNQRTMSMYFPTNLYLLTSTLALVLSRWRLRSLAPPYNSLPAQTSLPLGDTGSWRQSPPGERPLCGEIRFSVQRSGVWLWLAEIVPLSEKMRGEINGLKGQGRRGGGVSLGGILMVQSPKHLQGGFVISVSGATTRALLRLFFFQRARIKKELKHGIFWVRGSYKNGNAGGIWRFPGSIRCDGHRNTMS